MADFAACPMSLTSRLPAFPGGRVPRASRAQRIELRGGVESDNESAYTLIEEQEEEELSYKEEVIGTEEIEIGDD